MAMKTKTKRRSISFRTTIRNHTEVPVDLIKSMIDFAKPPGVSGFEIVLRNTPHQHGWKGWAFWAGLGNFVASGRDPRKPLITIKVPRGVNGKAQPEMVYGYDNRSDTARARRGKAGYLTGDHWSDHEHLLHLIAHELRHLWQARVKKGRRVWGARGQFSEKDCDSYAIKITRDWRRK